MATVVEGDFEWDSAKAASNITKHGVSFFEAATVPKPESERSTRPEVSYEPSIEAKS
jgi:uncharacterized DUF497 family protein